MILKSVHIPTPGEAIDLLREHEPPEGYTGCFSGGKDSVVIKELARRAAVRVNWIYHVTTIDPPELVKFIKRNHSDVTFERSPYGNFFNRMVERGSFPLRHIRWCCQEYKEQKFAPDATVIMGIRAEESTRRAAHWDLTCRHWKWKNLVINPIFQWSSDELWKFIHDQKIPYCSLYDEGFKRLGCIGCPMTSAWIRKKEFQRWPRFEKKWQDSFKKIWEQSKGKRVRGRLWFGEQYFNDWREMWAWWLNQTPLPNKKQLNLF